MTGPAGDIHCPHGPQSPIGLACAGFYSPPGMSRKPETPLRRGWTTGACATAATRAALMRLWGEGCPESARITLPGGETPDFEVAHWDAGDGWAEAGIVKDAGDDPDVTHGALIIARVAAAGPGVSLHAGEGVGTVTKAGLPSRRGSPRSTRCRGG